jgi:hypothetical protein
MHRRIAARTLAWVAALAVATPAAGVLLVDDGNEPPSRECLVGVEWDAPSGSVLRGVGVTALTCGECDGGCDADGFRNGTCFFRLRLCTNVPSRACKERPIVFAKASPAKAGLAVAAQGSRAATCGPWTLVAVPTRHRKSRTKPGRLRLTAKAKAALNDVQSVVDIDHFFLVCEPRPVGEPCPNSVGGAFVR